MVFLWGATGYQKIEMSDEFAASMIVSNIDPGVEIQSPWPCFVIDVPDGLLPYVHSSISKVLVVRGQDSWSIIGMSDKPRAGGYESVACLSMDKLTGPDAEINSLRDIAGGEGMDTKALNETSNALIDVLKRLVASTCIACTVPGLLQKRPEPNGPRPSKPGLPRPKGPPAPPTFARYVLGKPINVDFRDRVRQFCRTGSFAGSKLEVRTMVRGHFKIVHHGPNWSLAKSKWIEPYWKGPEDGLTIVRPHVMKEPEKAATA